MNEDMIDSVHKSIIHIKSKPTLKAISKLYISLKSHGYNVNKLNYDEYNYDSVLRYCDYIEKFVKENILNTFTPNTPKNKYIHVKFKENILIPQNANIGDNDEDEDYQFNNDKYSVVSESGSESGSERGVDDVDDVEDEYYDSGNDEFSD